MKSLRELVKIVESNGFVLNRQNGSHCIYKHITGKIVVVPVKHNDKVCKGIFCKVSKAVSLKETT